MSDRPVWCPHQSCRFLGQVESFACLGELPNPPSRLPFHDTHRICLEGEGEGEDGNTIIQAELSRNDITSLSRFLLNFLSFGHC